MLSSCPKVPKYIQIEICKAERLYIQSDVEDKRKKGSPKWKVFVTCGDKIAHTNSVHDPDGNPVWNANLTLKVPSGCKLVYIHVSGPKNCKVGQVVIPVTEIPEKRPTQMASETYQIKDLESAKEGMSASGKLHYGIWVTEYRSEEKSKGLKSSMSSLHGGSMISLSSDQPNFKHEKRRNPFGRKRGKDIFKSAANLSESGFMNRKTTADSRMIPLYDPTKDHDGSILGAYSDLTNSELENMSMNACVPPSNSHVPKKNSSFLQLSGQSEISSKKSPLPSLGKHVSTVSTDQQSLETYVHSRMKATPTDKKSKPSLLSITPMSCSTEGGVEVTVCGQNLSEDVMKHATVLVNGINVPRQDWFHEEPKTEHSDISELRIHMPTGPTGRCWIELETMGYGRIRCPQEFTYVQTPVSTNSTVPQPRLDPMRMSRFGGSPPVRTGSQRSSLLVRDRRSTRIKKQPKENSPSESVFGTDPGKHGDETKEEKSHTEKSGFSLPVFNYDSGISSLPETTNLFSDKDSQNQFSEGDFRHNKTTEVMQRPYLPVETPPSFRSESKDKSTFEYHEDTDSSSENVAFEESHQNLPTSYRNADRRVASSQSRDMPGSLEDANNLIALLFGRISVLEQEYAEKERELDDTRQELCHLRNQLLNDGVTKYLDKTMSPFKLTPHQGEYQPSR